MALTVEEKISALETFEDWGKFTEPQKRFLINLAKGMSETTAYATAYPETKQTSLPVATAQMLGRAGIQKALRSIDIDVSKPVVSRKEAMELLSRHMRKQEIEPETLVKLLGTYSKIAGWDAEPKKEPEETVDMNKLVAQVESNRRKG